MSDKLIEIAKANGAIDMVDFNTHDHDTAAIFYSSAITSMHGEAKPVAWYYRFKNAKGWGLWTISCGSEKPVNVAFEDMEARPLVFGDTYPPSAASKIAEQDARIKELEQQLGVARKAITSDTAKCAPL